MNNELISRSTLKEHIERYADIPCYAKQEVYDRIEDCNTAYDVDKVIEQLLGNNEIIRANPRQSTINLEEAIRIVKAGGVNE